MLLFAHVGLAIGAGMVSEKLSLKIIPAHLQSSSEIATQLKEGSPVSKVKTNIGLFDMRFWIIGSILPDLIDKPIGHLFFSSYFQSYGRLSTHSLIFLLLILAGGLFVRYVYKWSWLLALSCGVAIHLLLDSMWQVPKTLFWPLLGWRFPAGGEGSWLAHLADSLVYNPAVYVPEIIGFIIVALFFLNLVRTRQTRQFLYTGNYQL